MCRYYSKSKRARRNGRRIEENKIKTYVALIPEGKDVNDLSKEEFSQVAAVTFKEWLLFYYKDNVRL